MSRYGKDQQLGNEYSGDPVDILLRLRRMVSMDIAAIIIASALALLILVIAVSVMITTIAKIRALGQVTKELEQSMPTLSADFAEQVRRNHEEIRRQRLERGEKA
jgi:hypothetical protein